ncbi:MAG: hypothetical protein GEV00_00505 [Actinophytocola sp.]|nr:hypothetical protein [Actinophytocola sp.]
MKRYLGAALAAFVLGCVGPVTTGAAQAAEQPDDGSSLLTPVTGTLGALTGQQPAPASGTLVTDAVQRVADTPRRLLTGVVRSNALAEPPELPETPEVPEAPAPPEQPAPPPAPEPPETTPPADAPADLPAVPVAPAADEVPAPVEDDVTEPEHRQPAQVQPAAAERPSAVTPDRTNPRGPMLGAAADHGSTTDPDPAAAEQPKPVSKTPTDVRADAVSLAQITRTPFVLAMALLTAVGLVTVRRVITAR